ncbi:MAG: carbamoyltransferase C-terminal domain-containing protein [Bacteroidota bacterium]
MKDVKMNIIGINVSHNASACLMIGGEIVIAAQEERFTKIKNFTGYPKQSIDYCLKYLADRGLKVDKVGFSTTENVAIWFAYPIQHYFKMKDYNNHYGDGFYGRKLKKEPVDDYYQKIIDNNSKNTAPTYLDYGQFKDIDSLVNNTEQFRDLQRAYAAEQCSVKPEQVEFIDHHTCHAYYAYFASKRKSDDCVVITLDSDGDGRNQTVWHFNKGDVKLLRSTNQCDLARIYKITTLILGMKPDEHEFKVMGMAPYAKPEYVDIVYKDVYEPLLKVEDSKVLHNERPADMYAYLSEKLKPYRFDNIAGAVQKLVEEVAIKLFKQVNELTGARNFAISGGVSMNIKMNMILSQLDFVDNVYVPASGSDESLCMGACYFLQGEDSAPLKNTYLGYDIKDDLSEEKIRSLFDDGHFEVSTNVDHKAVAKILAGGNVVAVARDREEFGARALGNRSIIASPNDPEVVKLINEAIKNRDFWMPFALSIMADHTGDYLVNPKKLDSPYMTIGFDTLDAKYKNIKAGTHPYDRTCRPQILKEEANQQYYDLISEFNNITGIPGLLNTSLNLHGNPICSTLSDVEYTFKNSGLNYLYINDNYLIKKRDSN